MGFENVTLWYAKDEKNNIITIDKAEQNKKYYCPICESEVIPRLGDLITHHYAHIDKSKCTNESFVHFWVKNELLKIGDKFTLSIGLKEEEYICKDLIIEKTYKTKYGDYKPDITVITNDNKIIYFEIAYTNMKRINEYRDKWEYLNNTVVEINAKELINGKEFKVFTPVYDNGIIYYNYTECRSKAEKLYENNIISNCEIEEAKSRLNKIDWFWCEWIKRKQNKISDEDFFKVIDLLHIDDRMFLIDKVLKSSCSDVRWLYLYNKQKEIKDYINDFINKNIDENNQLNIIEVETGEELVFRNIFGKRFQIPYVKIKRFKTCIYDIYCDYFDKDKLDLFLNNFMNCTGLYLKNKIKESNEILNKVLKNYNISINKIQEDYQKIILNINYTNNTIDKLEIQDIKNSDILKQATHIIYKHKKNNKLTGMEEDIKNYIDSKKIPVNNLYKINDNNLVLTYNEYREDELILYLNLMNIYDETKKYLFLIKSDEIRSPEGIYKFNNIEDFKEKFNEILSFSIRKIRYNI